MYAGSMSVGGAGVYILSPNFKIAPKARGAHAKNSYICPHFVLFLSSFGLFLKKLFKFW